MPLTLHAVSYALDGWPVVPLRGKMPVTEHGVKDWIIHPNEIIRHRWESIGLCTGHLFFCLDVDGPSGQASLTRLMGQSKIPRTPIAKTGKGWHYYFLMPKKIAIPNKVGFRAGLDTRGANGYVVAPPSLHSSGVRYRWIISPKEADLADAPRWLLKAITAKPRPRRRRHDNSEFSLESIGRIPDGERNVRLYKYACAAAARGKTKEEILSEIKWINANRCDPPKPEREINVIARSASRHIRR